ncbi:hypothetical protein DU508_03350 [Pedobacter chinensis]|uniref:Uncharacterized protein n=1 Tax=Pedobacter chinensis TaxID=2282421 RepID=A0A369Q400_9SPHI|nr:hypothetical protein DU508_03350 [Pedobacter chinensis]
MDSVLQFPQLNFGLFIQWLRFGNFDLESEIKNLQPSTLFIFSISKVLLNENSYEETENGR